MVHVRGLHRTHSGLLATIDTVPARLPAVTCASTRPPQSPLLHAALFAGPCATALGVAPERASGPASVNVLADQVAEGLANGFDGALAAFVEPTTRYWRTKPSIPPRARGRRVPSAFRPASLMRTSTHQTSRTRCCLSVIRRRARPTRSPTAWPTISRSTGAQIGAPLHTPEARVEHHIAALAVDVPRPRRTP